MKDKGKYACKYKVKYMSEEQAKHFSLNGVLRSYKCPYCDGWHNTSEGALGFGRKAKCE